MSNKISPKRNLIEAFRLRVFKARYYVQQAIAVARLKIGARDPEDRLARDSQAFWNNSDRPEFHSESHWRESGPFQSGSLWDDLGNYHHELLQKAVDFEGAQALKTIVEWGCGGGLNAVRWAGQVERFYGVEVSAATLAECERQVEKAGHHSFRGVLIESQNPHQVFEEISEKCDALICTYVFEPIPSAEYGLALVEIARKLVRDNGVALIQIRYHTGWLDQAKPIKFARFGVAHTCTYRIDEFWVACLERGWIPQFVHLLPEQPSLNEQRYAYFALRADPDWTSTI